MTRQAPPPPFAEIGPAETSRLAAELIEHGPGDWPSLPTLPQDIGARDRQGVAEAYHDALRAVGLPILPPRACAIAIKTRAHRQGRALTITERRNVGWLRVVARIGAAARPTAAAA